jgi:hypothetical protein
MNREVHVRFCEGVGVKFPRATRPLIHTQLEFSLVQNIWFCQRGEKKTSPTSPATKASEG